MTKEIERENPFHHNKSIRVGKAKVPYDDTSGIKGGVVCLAGWLGASRRQANAGLHDCLQDRRSDG